MEHTQPPLANELFANEKRYTGQERGFGQLWHKSYQVTLCGAHVSPEEVITTWRERFTDFWPKGSHIQNEPAILATGMQASIYVGAPLGLGMVTGFLVQETKPNEFTLLTADDHIFAGQIRFSAHPSPEGVVVMTEATVRPNDPIWDLFFRLGLLTKMEDLFWQYTLKQIAAHYGCADAEVHNASEILDPQVRWEHAGNVTRNLAVLTVLERLGRLVQRAVSRSGYAKPEGLQPVRERAEQARTGLAFLAILTALTLLALRLRARRPS